jgi:hypothetical protein
VRANKGKEKEKGKGVTVEVALDSNLSALEVEEEGG